METNSQNFKKKKFNVAKVILLAGVIILAGGLIVFKLYHIPSSKDQSQIDPSALKQLTALDSANRQATFVFVEPELAQQIKHNKVIMLPPIDNNLRIDFTRYEHKGRYGNLYIVIPESYHGPKEKFILKSFPGYKGWYGSMLSNNLVMYAAH